MATERALPAALPCAFFHQQPLLLLGAGVAWGLRHRPGVGWFRLCVHCGSGCLFVGGAPPPPAGFTSPFRLQVEVGALGLGLGCFLICCCKRGKNSQPQGSVRQVARAQGAGRGWGWTLGLPRSPHCPGLSSAGLQVHMCSRVPRIWPQSPTLGILPLLRESWGVSQCGLPFPPNSGPPQLAMLQGDCWACTRYPTSLTSCLCVGFPELLGSLFSLLPLPVSP